MSATRVRVSDEKVLEAMLSANGEKTIVEVADSLNMKENTLRAQAKRIQEKLSEVKKTVPGFKDGRSVKNSLDSLLDVVKKFEETNPVSE